MADLFILLTGIVLGGLWVSFSKESSCKDCSNRGFYRVQSNRPDDYDSMLCECQIGQGLQKEGFGPTTIYAHWRDWHK